MGAHVAEREMGTIDGCRAAINHRRPDGAHVAKCRKESESNAMRLNVAGVVAVVVFLLLCVPVGYAIGSNLGAAEWRVIGLGLTATAAALGVFVLAYRE